MLRYIDSGDSIVVYSMDRLARNLDDLRRLVNDLTAMFIWLESPIRHALRDRIKEAQNDASNAHTIRTSVPFKFKIYDFATLERLDKCSMEFEKTWDEVNQRYHNLRN